MKAFRLFLVIFFIYAQCFGSYIVPKLGNQATSGSFLTQPNLMLPGNTVSAYSTNTNYLATGNFNLLKDPDLQDSGTSNWSTDVNTTLSKDATVLFNGQQTLKAVVSGGASAARQIIYQQFNTPSGLSGQNLEISLWVRTASSNVNVCSLANSSCSSTINVPSDDSWHFITFPNIAANATSNGLAVQTTTGNTQTVNIAYPFVGLSKNFLPSSTFAPVVQKFTSGTNTYNPTYYFRIVAGSATAAATYTNNGATFTVSSTISSGLVLQTTGTGAPNSSGVLTKASGTGDSTITYFAYAAPLWARVVAVGGGGGGAGSGTAAPSAAGDGGSTTIGSLLTASGGIKGVWAGSGDAGAGGTCTLSGMSGITATGSYGQGGQLNQTLNATNPSGGSGGASILGGSGGGGRNLTAGFAGVTNTGGGGGGGGAGPNAGNYSGGGGGAGGGCDATWNNPSSQTVTIGAAGTAGGTGTNGTAGSAGGSGLAVIYETF